MFYLPSCKLTLIWWCPPFTWTAGAKLMDEPSKHFLVEVEAKRRSINLDVRNAYKTNKHTIVGFFFNFHFSDKFSDLFDSEKYFLEEFDLQILFFAQGVKFLWHIGPDIFITCQTFAEWHQTAKNKVKLGPFSKRKKSEISFFHFHL